MRIGELDTDSQALAARLAAQNAASSVNLNDWIFERLEPRPGDICLDLGCGTGNQSIELARTVAPDGSVTSIDISAESLGALNRTAAAKGLSDRIRTICSSLDAFGADVADMRFTRIVASYCLYYVNDARGMFETIHGVMADGARLFFCGPGHANNLALLEMTAAVGGKNGLGRRPAVEFMEDESQTICREIFGAGNVAVHRIDNEVAYKTADDLIAYWTNHNLYEAAVADAFANAAKAHFSANDVFVNKKSIVGVMVST